MVEKIIDFSVALSTLSPRVIKHWSRFPHAYKDGRPFPELNPRTKPSTMMMSLHLLHYLSYSVVLTTMPFFFLGLCQHQRH